MTKKTVLCAVAFNGHDSSVSFAIGERIVLVLEAERFFRVKKKYCTPSEMETLIAYGAESLGISVDDIGHWALASFFSPWLSQAQTQRLVTSDYFWDEVTISGKTRRCLIVSHHYCHAAAFFVSGYEKAIVQTCDGGGDFYECGAAFAGDGLSLERLDYQDENAINGRAYHIITGFFYRERFCEGKAMALAAFGTPNPRYAALIEELLPLLTTGLVRIERGESPESSHAKFAIGMDRTEETLTKAIGGLFKGPGQFGPDTLDFLATFQSFFVDRRAADFAKLAAKYPAPAAVLAGGACLNLAANTAIYAGGAERLFVPPNCDDTGQSFGALCKLITLVYGKRPLAELPFLGLGDDEIDLSQLDQIADVVAAGETVFVHNGKAELGPRALGHRSVIARADLAEKKKETSEGIKQREPYRPVAPITTEEALRDYFDGPPSSPFMLHSYTVKPSAVDGLAGVTHVDGTARAQTVTETSDPFMYALLQRYGTLSGAPILLNTSLNLKGDPISNEITDTKTMAKVCEGRGIPVRIVHNGVLI